tara:strand:- start:4067 stop:4261 length:195 start_codon:yes stop_codon:yes gene_type:complete
MSNHDLKPLHYSNTTITQNPENTSGINVFALVDEQSTQSPQQTEEVSRTVPVVPQTVSSGGSSY